MEPEVQMTPEDIQKFSLEIEELVYMKDIPYIDAVIMYCEQTGFEIETAAKLVSGVLKSKIKIEAEELHFLKKSNTSQLPL
jgi:hypothetical protein